MIQDRKELLQLIHNREAKRIASLEIGTLQKEVSEWFNDEILECESRFDIECDYMTDFMRYREAESTEELQNYWNNIK